MSMKQVALVTYGECPQLSDDDRLLVPRLRAIGVEPAPVVWDDPSVDWAAFDQVILRSCWDYHLRSVKFLDWIHRLKSGNVALQNPASLVLWNADKRYLRELEKCDFLIPETYWVEEGQEVQLGDVLSLQRWRDVVVKPTISATAYQTRRMSEKDADELISGPTMVQEFLAEVQIRGEWSLMFLGGEFSHAIRKFPASGDFRVQSQFGGTVQAAVAKPDFIENAAAVLEAIEDGTLYARVDGVEREGEFVLMELELIEPALFLGLGNAADDFAEKIASSI
jgi:glutathione synthase/RimK-type ligase-like ATP-grasp enzyme